MVENGEEVKKCGIVIVYDFCYMLCEFVFELVVVLGYYGVKSYVFDVFWLIFEFFFVVCYLNVFGGIVIIVSYNLLEYNGYKIYGEDGG